MLRKVMLGINILSVVVFFSFWALALMEKENIFHYIFGSERNAMLIVGLSFLGLFIPFVIEPWAVNVRIVNDDRTCHCCQWQANHKHEKQ
jgi:hypothetical protein